MAPLSRMSFARIFIGTVALIFLPSLSFAETVGRTSAVVPNAKQTPPGGGTSMLAMSAPIYRNATLQTSSSAALEVTFVDNSKLSMGQNSEMVVDEFTYAGPGSASSQALSFGRGVFRYVSGAVQKDKVKLRTPNATIGIRGTKVRIRNDSDGSSTVGVEDERKPDEYGNPPPPDKAKTCSEIDITTNSGQKLTLKCGEYVRIDTDGSFGDVQIGNVPGC